MIGMQWLQTIKSWANLLFLQSMGLQAITVNGLGFRSKWMELSDGSILLSQDSMVLIKEEAITQEM